MWPSMFWPGEEGETIVTEGSGLYPLPGIVTDWHMILVRGDDYTGSRAIYFPAAEGKPYPVLDGEVTMTIRIDGTATTITGEVATVDDEDRPMVEIPKEKIPLAGRGVFDIEHINSDGEVQTLVMGSVDIRADVTVPEE